MPIPLNTNNSRPSAKLLHVGSGMELCIIGTRTIPLTEFGTDRPVLGDNGQPRKQLRLTGIVVSAQGAMTGQQGQERPVGIGEVVDVYIKGHNWGLYIEAEKALNTAGMQMQVGDILLQHFTHMEPSSRAGAQDKRVKACTIRRARPDEQHWVAQAEAAYYALGFDKADPDAGQAPQAEPFPAQPVYGQSVVQQPQYAPQPQQGYAPQQQPQYAPQPQYPAQQPMAPQQPQVAPQQPQYGQPAPQQPQQGYAPQTGAQPPYGGGNTTGF